MLGRQNQFSDGWSDTQLKSIYLTGFMGAGKTTVGKTLGEKLNLPVYDSDEMIIKQQQRSIEDIFKVNGETYFRNLETDVLRSLPTRDAIITTGGGIILKKENRDFMKENGIVIFLYCSPEMIFERLKDDNSRPLLQGDKMQEIKTRLENRLPLYKEADYTVDTTHITVDEVVENILQLLNEHSFTDS